MANELTLKTKRKDKDRKAKIFNAQEGVCILCGGSMSFRRASKEHIVPRPLGGSRWWGNIALAHRACNMAKGDELPSDELLERFFRLFGYYPKMKDGTNYAPSYKR